MRSWLIALALVAFATGCGEKSGSTAGAAPGTVATETDTAVSAPAKASPGCRAVGPPAARKDGGAKPPSKRLDPEQTYELVFATNCGSFTVTLDQAQSPATAASLVALARARFFDGTLFHRIVPGFVIQGGDPTQSGTGGPGYTTRDTPPAAARYVKGVVAMAKSQAESAGTSGSQFFVVTGADIGLPPDYAIVGKVTQGLAVVERIGKLGDPATELPTEAVVIAKVTVVEQP
jgi:peptidyl-prolyl cis-trans isomerase B (cyclophilin B)